jgi:hypothetical protein
MSDENDPDRPAEGMMRHKAVVFDPLNRVAEGSFLPIDDVLAALHRRGIRAIEVDADIRRTALSPFTKTFAGEDAVLHLRQSTTVGKGALWLRRNRGYVSWAAMLRYAPDAIPMGSLGLVGEAGSEGIAQAPISGASLELSLEMFSRKEEEGYVVVEGVVACQTAQEGLYGFALRGWGNAPSRRGDERVRLLWLALGQV